MAWISFCCEREQKQAKSLPSDSLFISLKRNLHFLFLIESKNAYRTISAWMKGSGERELDSRSHSRWHNEKNHLSIIYWWAHQQLVHTGLALFQVYSLYGDSLQSGGAQGRLHHSRGPAAWNPNHIKKKEKKTRMWAKRKTDGCKKKKKMLHWLCRIFPTFLDLSVFIFMLAVLVGHAGWNITQNTANWSVVTPAAARLLVDSVRYKSGRCRGGCSLQRAATRSNTGLPTGGDR